MNQPQQAPGPHQPPFGMRPPGKLRQAQAAGGPIEQGEREHALYAHLLGAVVGLFTTGVIFPAMAPTLVLVFRSSRHPFLLFHINQAMWFQGLISLFLALNWVVFLIGYLATCGIGALVLFPVCALLHAVMWLVSVVLPIVVGFGARDGKWTRYPIIGDMVLDQASPLVDE